MLKQVPCRTSGTNLDVPVQLYRNSSPTWVQPCSFVLEVTRGGDRSELSLIETWQCSGAAERACVGGWMSAVPGQCRTRRLGLKSNPARSNHHQRRSCFHPLQVGCPHHPRPLQLCPKDPPLEHAHSFLAFHCVSPIERRQ
jgi:hypothetical protein